MAELAAVRRIAERCFHDLHHAFGSPVIASDAVIGRPITKDPRILGWLVEHAMATALAKPGEAAARVRALARLAADIDGGSRSAFESRPTRVRRHLFEPSPDVEQLALQLPVVHPSKWADVAAHLGVDDARSRIADDEAPLTVVARLPEEMLLTAIPRIPEDERPPLVFPPRDRFGSATTIADPLTLAYDDIVALPPYIAAILDPNAPEILRQFLQDNMQSRIERLARAAGDDDLYALDAWGVRDTERPASFEMIDNGMPCAPSCVWLTDDTVAIALDGLAHVRSIARGDEGYAFSIGDLRLQSCDERGRLLLVGPTVDLADYSFGTGFGCHDLEAKTWVDAVPPELPAVTYLHAINEPGPHDNRTEHISLADYRTGATIELEPPADGRVCFARGNAAVMTRQGLRSCVTGFIEVAPEILLARAADDAMPVHHTPEANDAPRPAGSATACANADGRWRFLLENGVVAEGDRALVRLTWPVCAASFSPDGKQLLVVGEYDVVIVDVERATATPYFFSTM
jgi:hypothetical protein